jgi:hypothetical protein
MTLPVVVYTGRSGVTAGEIQGMLAGIPNLRFLNGQEAVTLAIIYQNVLAAEDKVGLDLDILIGVREIRCINDQTEPTDEMDDSIIIPAFDKPRNWFAGDRWGALKLPYLPAKSVISVTAHPYGYYVGNLISIPLDRIRLEKGLLQFVPGPLGTILPTNYALSVSYGFGYGQFQDGQMLPGGLEVVYTAGLSPRDLKRHPIIKTLIQLEALILTITFYQGWIGGGAQKETAGSDGQTNTVELARRDHLGVLGGEISAMKSSYNELLRSVRATFNAVRTVWL